MTATITDIGASPATTNAFSEAQEAVRSQLSTLTSCGNETRAQIVGLMAEADARLAALQESAPPNAQDEAAALQQIVQTLAERLPSRWTDICAAQVLFFVGWHLKQKPPSLRYVAENITNWLEYHVDQPDKFNYCLKISPPAGIAIERVLNAGAQKQVFVANWPDVTPYKVAFKHFHDSDGAGSGDAFSHPLRGHHPNIIETFPLEKAGDQDDVYLVERLLSTTLEYGWNFGGLGEIVNLIRDIAHALSYVHSYKRIHGDVKLENIGFDGLYILLDFGLCRSEPADTCAWTPTGNVRAMAPELLHGKANTAASDVWALGSVAYAALTNRPPFLTPWEKQQGFGENGERKRKLESLAKRADDPEWCRDIGRRIATAVPEVRLRQLLMEMLDHEPARRPTARQVFQTCSDEFPQFLRPVAAIVQAAPKEELKSLLYLRDSGGLALASPAQLIAFGDAAGHIDVNQLDKLDQLRLEELRVEIGSR
jgi:hypothetical protein